MRRRAQRSEMTVDDLNLYIQGMFQSDLMLRTVAVEGEIAEFKQHTSGHCYFTLLGEETRISCALFKRDAEALPQWPRNGDSVLVDGSVGAYPQRGVYQLYARRIHPVGAGAIDRARQELKMRLEAEGLFSPDVKRPIPPYPSRAAVVTSATGAALRDVLRISARRYPLCEIVVVPTLVQGADAPEAIAWALARTASLGRLDCVLLVRGGGSREDLIPFDDERVVRAVRACPWPVVSGVGHEVDETLCDLAADLRASTPSAAAELVFPDRITLLSQVHEIEGALTGAMLRRIETLRGRCRHVVERMRMVLERRLSVERGALRSRFRSLTSAMALRLSEAKREVAVRAARLDALSPLTVLSRGFVTAERGRRRILSVRDLAPGEDVSLRFADGRAECLVRAAQPTLPLSHQPFPKRTGARGDRGA